MTKARTCIELKSSLPAGLPEVFCPTCALHRALAIGGSLLSLQGKLRAREGIWSLSWLRGLRIGKQPTEREISQQIALASAEEKAKECSEVTEFAPGPGDVIEDYEILEKIGGNMGLVFKARHRPLDKGG